MIMFIAILRVFIPSLWNDYEPKHIGMFYQYRFRKASKQETT